MLVASKGQRPVPRTWIWSLYPMAFHYECSWCVGTSGQCSNLKGFTILATRKCWSWSLVLVAGQLVLKILILKYISVVCFYYVMNLSHIDHIEIWCIVLDCDFVIHWHAVLLDLQTVTLFHVLYLLNLTLCQCRLSSFTPELWQSLVMSPVWCGQGVLCRRVSYMWRYVWLQVQSDDAPFSRWAASFWHD